MGKLKNYIQLHLNIMHFSFTGIFSKAASVRFNQYGLLDWLLWVFAFLMLLNCFVYALAWQRVIKKFPLSTAYANRSVYIIWSQLWAVLIFKEHLSIGNILGMLIVFIGVMVVSSDE